MKNKLIILAFSAGISISISISLYSYFAIPKIVFVNSSVLVEKYTGMKEVRQFIDSRSKERSSRLDSLYAAYTIAQKQLGGSNGKMASNTTNFVSMDAAQKYSEYMKFKEEAETTTKEESDRLIQGALNQVNSYIESYSKSHGIDIVVGVTLSGNLLYGSDRVDITSDIVDGLNKSYK